MSNMIKRIEDLEEAFELIKFETGNVDISNTYPPENPLESIILTIDKIATQVIKTQFDINSIPEGCTPKDAQVLRKANHEISEQNWELQQEVERLVDITDKLKRKLDVAEELIDFDYVKELHEGYDEIDRD